MDGGERTGGNSRLAGGGAVSLDVYVDGRHVTVGLELPATNGWGREPDEWRFVSCRVGSLAAGQHHVKLATARAEAKANIDGFYLASAERPPPGLRDARILTREALTVAVPGIHDIRQRVPTERVIDRLTKLAPVEVKHDVSLRDLLDHSAGQLPRGVRQALARKPSPYIVKAHDVGAPTNVHADFAWHLLDKEKDNRFDLPHHGKLGIVNPNSDVNFCLGFGLDDAPVFFDPPRSYRDHLINLAAQEIRLGQMCVTVAFLTVASDTVLAIVTGGNESDQPHSLRIEALCTKPAVEDYPIDRYGYGIHVTTGKLQWIKVDPSHRILFASYDEWDRLGAQPIGQLLCTMLGSDMQASYRTELDNVPRPFTPAITSVGSNLRLSASRYRPPKRSTKRWSTASGRQETR